MVELDVRPGDRYAFVRTFDIGGASVRMLFRWLPNPARWMIQLQDVNGAPASLPQFVQPGGEVVFDKRRADLPSGVLRWQGDDGYGRLDLGTRVILLFEADEAPPATRINETFRRLDPLIVAGRIGQP
jgi:hypothetical protein